MTLKRAIVVFWCLFSCVTCQTTGVQFVRPTPVFDIAAEIRSTDAGNPLKFNKESGAEPFSTGIFVPSNENGLVNPTPVLTEFTTTGAANPVINNDGIIPQWTKPSDIQPTSIINVPVVFETDSRYPLNFNNIPVIISSTGIIEDSFIKPTSVIKVSETTAAAAAIPLTNDDASEAPLSTGVFNFIEPSTVLKTNEESTTAATPNLVGEKPNEVLSTQVISPTTTQSIPRYTCNFYEHIRPPSFGWRAPGHPHKSHFKYQEPKINTPLPPINIYQKIFNLHFNFFVNDYPVPVLSGNMYQY